MKRDNDFYCFIHFFSLIITLFVEIMSFNTKFDDFLIIVLARLFLLQIYLILEKKLLRDFPNIAIK